MSTAAVIRTHVLDAPAGTFFHVADFPGTRRAVESAISRLAADVEDLVRVRRGLYWKAARSRDGATRPDAVAVAVQAARNRGVGPAGWLAAHAMGLAPRTAAVPELVVVGEPPSGVDGVRFRSRSNYSRLRLSYLEVGLLELLRDVPAAESGGWSDLVDAVAALDAAGELSVARTVAIAEDERHVALRRHAERLLRDLRTPGVAVVGRADPTGEERPARELARTVAARGRRSGQRRTREEPA